MSFFTFFFFLYSELASFHVLSFKEYFLLELLSLPWLFWLRNLATAGIEGD